MQEPGDEGAAESEPPGVKRTSSSVKYPPGTAVWAKVEGHDWWPAKVVRCIVLETIFLADLVTIRVGWQSRSMGNLATIKISGLVAANFLYNQYSR